MREGVRVGVGRGLAPPPWDLLTGRQRLSGDTRKLSSPLTEHQDASPQPLMRREASSPFPDEQTDCTKMKGAPGGLSLRGVRLLSRGGFQPHVGYRDYLEIKILKKSFHFPRQVGDITHNPNACLPRHPTRGPSETQSVTGLALDSGLSRPLLHRAASTHNFLAVKTAPWAFFYKPQSSGTQTDSYRRKCVLRRIRTTSLRSRYRGCECARGETFNVTSHWRRDVRVRTTASCRRTPSKSALVKRNNPCRPSCGETRTQLPSMSVQNTAAALQVGRVRRGVTIAAQHFRLGVFTQENCPHTPRARTCRLAPFMRAKEGKQHQRSSADKTWYIHSRPCDLSALTR